MAFTSKFIDISIVGNREIIKKFKKFEFKIQKKTITKSFRKIAKKIKKAVKPKIPVGTEPKFGKKRLFKTLKIRALKRSRVRTGLRIITGVRKDLRIKKSKKKYYYPAAVEWGFKHVRSGKRIRGKKFMSKTFGDRKERYMNMLIADIKEEIRKL